MQVVIKIFTLRQIMCSYHKTHCQVIQQTVAFLYRKQSILQGVKSLKYCKSKHQNTTIQHR